MTEFNKTNAKQERINIQLLLSTGKYDAAKLRIIHLIDQLPPNITVSEYLLTDNGEKS